jgi:hypothetical protein
VGCLLWWPKFLAVRKAGVSETVVEDGTNSTKDLTATGCALKTNQTFQDPLKPVINTLRINISSPLTTHQTTLQDRDLPSKVAKRLEVAYQVITLIS